MRWGLLLASLAVASIVKPVAAQQLQASAPTVLARAPGHVHADDASLPPEVARAAAQRAERRVSVFVSAGKWVTLGAAAASAVYGFTESRRADEAYDELERDCQAAPDLCRQRNENGAYLDPDFEDRYQDVLSIDRRTRQALFVTQASLLASAVLFVLDLRGDDDRPDVPYVPPQLDVGPGAQGELRLGARLPVAGR